MRKQNIEVIVEVKNPVSEVTSIVIEVKNPVIEVINPGAKANVKDNTFVLIQKTDRMKLNIQTLS